ncbi:MAG: organic solvent tolerance protein OstA [Treponema sp.]|nr:organic solvent tolerance protein OstA [Treponema sp.]
MKKLLFILLTLFTFNLLFAEEIIFSANSMKGKSGDSSSSTRLIGNAYIKTETMEIKAEEVELYGEDYRNISAVGNVSGVNTESHMEFTCDSMKYDRETKIASLEGNVNLVDKDNDVKAQAQIIEYNQESDIAVLQIKINLTQKDNVCSGAYAIYHKKEQVLELSGNAQIKQKEDLFRAQYITLDMDTQDITLGGNVKGTVKDSKSSPSSDSEAVEEEKSNQQKPEEDKKENPEETAVNNSEAESSEESKEESSQTEESESKSQASEELSKASKKFKLFGN